MKKRHLITQLKNCLKRTLLFSIAIGFPILSNAQTGTSGSPFTELGMARNVSSAGLYYFNLSGTTFSSYVDANGWMHVAIDRGGGSGSLPQVTSLNTGTRGILNTTVLSKLTSATEARLSSTTGNINVVTSNATILSRITQNYILSRGAVDNTINSGWTGTNLNGTQFTGCCGCTQSNTALNSVVFHACGNSGGFHWVPTSNMHTENNTNNEISSSHYFQLWVRAPLVAVVNGPTINTHPSSSAQNLCLNSSATSLSVSATSGSTISYQWYSNTSASNSGGTLISGATSTSYTPPTNVSGVKYYYVVCTHTGGSTTSNVSGAVTVNALSVAGTVSSDQTICSGSSAANITLSGNTGSIQWQVSTNNSSFSNISGATSATLASGTIGTITSTKYYRANVTNGNCSSVTSTVVTINTTALPSAPSGNTTQAFCSGETGGCAVFSGSNALTSNANANFSLGTSDFTYESWFYPTSSSGTQAIFGIGDGSSNSTQVFYNYPGQTGKIGFVVYGSISLFSTGTISLNTWTHVAFVRESGVLKLYINGVLNNSIACTANFTKNQISIGRPYYNLSQEYFVGRITNTRLIKGTAQYTSNFTVPNSALTAVSGTVLLLKSTESSSLLTDASSSGHTLSNNGSVTWNSATPFTGSSITIANLSATGTDIQWYAASTGGSPLASSTALVNNTIYYASQTVGSCTSETRLAVTANLSNTVPVYTTTAQNGDLIWRGTESSSWSSLNNWYAFNGSTHVVPSALPVSVNNVIIPVADGLCVVNYPSIDMATISIQNLNIENGSSLSLNSNLLNIYGNYVNNGTFNTGTGTVRFNGTNAQSVTGTATFYNLTINNTSGGITLNSPVSVGGTLLMAQGNIITTGTNILEIGLNTSSVGSVSWTSGTIVGPMKRWFAAATNATQASGIFPLGNSTHNRNAQINFTQAPSAGGYIIAEYITGAPMVNSVALYAGLPAVINGQMIQNYENEGYYEITPYNSSNVAYGALNNVLYDLTLRGNQLSSVNDLTKLRIIKSSNHLAWNDNPAGDGDHVEPIGTTSDFTIGAEGMVGFSWFDIGSSSDNTLPIELLSFSANCNSSNNIDINWTTASEHNTSHFVLEKSRNGFNWLTIGKIPAAGNSTSLLHYSFVDSENSFEIMYYRLTQFDNDGESESFPIATVNCSDENAEATMKIFPNPSRGEFFIDVYKDGHSGDAQITIQNMNGMVLYTEKVLASKGQNILPIMNLGLAGGIYLVTVQFGEMVPMMSKVRIE